MSIIFIEFRIKYEQAQSNINDITNEQIKEITKKLSYFNYEEIKSYGTKLDLYERNFQDFVKSQKIMLRKELYDSH